MKTLKCPSGATGSVVGTICPTCNDFIKSGQAVLSENGFPKEHAHCWSGWKNYREGDGDSSQQAEKSTGTAV